MTTLREAAARYREKHPCEHETVTCPADEALRSALSAPEPAPVGWREVVERLERLAGQAERLATTSRACGDDVGYANCDGARGAYHVALYHLRSAAPPAGGGDALREALAFCQQQLSIYVQTEDCDCAECPSCGAMPSECKAPCSLTCDCTTCDWCLSTMAIERASAALSTPPAPSEATPSVDVEARPRIVCLCGSTRFMEAFQEANLSETLAGRIVLSIGCNTKSDAGLALGDDVKARLDELHKRKIDLADEVLILNVDGYVGASTQREIAYAIYKHRPIRWLDAEAGERLLDERASAVLVQVAAFVRGETPAPTEVRDDR
jgi:hypothetical protein